MKSKIFLFILFVKVSVIAQISEKQVDDVVESSIKTISVRKTQVH